MQRAVAFERDNLALAAEHREEHPLGMWMRSAGHPQMWSLNQLYVEGPRPDLTAPALVAELDRGLTDARHRRAVVTDDATGRSLAAGMRDAGYGAVPLGILLLDGSTPEPPQGLAHEIDEPAMHALETRIVAGGSVPEHDRSVVIEGHAHVRRTVPGTRMFAGVRDGADVCQTTLYIHDGIAQPEDVETLPAHQGHGLAAATVSLATHAALAAGADLVFLLCDLAEGPVALYAGLGYRAAGRMWTFTRPG